MVRLVALLLCTAPAVFADAPAAAASLRGKTSQVFFCLRNRREKLVTLHVGRYVDFQRIGTYLGAGVVSFLKEGSPVCPPSAAVGWLLLSNMCAPKSM